MAVTESRFNRKLAVYVATVTALGLTIGGMGWAISMGAQAAATVQEYHLLQRRVEALEQDRTEGAKILGQMENGINLLVGEAIRTSEKLSADEKGKYQDQLDGGTLDYDRLRVKLQLGY